MLIGGGQSSADDELRISLLEAQLEEKDKLIALMRRERFEAIERDAALPDNVVPMRQLHLVRDE